MSFLFHQTYFQAFSRDHQGRDGNGEGSGRGGCNPLTRLPLPFSVVVFFCVCVFSNHFHQYFDSSHSGEGVRGKDETWRGRNGLLHISDGCL